jgi:hypothetical protein
MVIRVISRLVNAGYSKILFRLFDLDGDNGSVSKIPLLSVVKDIAV